jgi:hypothetical protein
MEVHVDPEDLERLIVERIKAMLPLREKLSSLSSRVKSATQLDLGSPMMNTSGDAGSSPAPLLKTRSLQEMKKSLASQGKIDPMEAEVFTMHLETRKLQHQKTSLLEELIERQEQFITNTDEGTELLTTAWDLEREAYIDAINEMTAAELEYIERIDELEQLLTEAQVNWESERKSYVEEIAALKGTPLPQNGSDDTHPEDDKNEVSQV